MLAEAEIDIESESIGLDKPKRKLPPHLWKVGQSGNPGGRVRGLERRVRELLGDDIDQIILAMRDIARSPGFKAADRINAAKLLMDRGWGQAQQTVTIETDATSSMAVDPSRLTPEQARALDDAMSIMLGDEPPSRAIIDVPADDADPELRPDHLRDLREDQGGGPR